MKTRFVNIILLLTLIYSPLVLLASPPAAENAYHSSAHSTLSCLDCHSYIKENSDHPSAGESNESCMECHESSSGYSPDNPSKVECLNCHYRHDEKVSNDAHTGVSCRACHLSDIKPVKKKESNRPVWKYEPLSIGEYDPHRFISEKENICSRCHYKGNNVDAPDQALPAKSIICMPCHSAAFSTGDAPSLFSIIIFIIGTGSIVFVWFSAGKGCKNEENKNANKFKTLILDILFQRRLLRASAKRWIIHGMIFFSFAIRFLWGITALVLSICKPGLDITWLMLDKNNPVTGLVYDITGIMIILGGLLMIVGKRINKNTRGIKDLPKSNIPVIALMGIMIISGFIVEGTRISMTGSPDGSQFAFVGYLISRILSDSHLNGIYVYLWYLHAVSTAVFIACLPFSRMFHIFTAPLSLLFRSASGK